jgi:hypothetical protein
MAQTYTYSISSDFPNGTVNTSKLENEIRSSSITIALDRIDTSGDTIDIIFKDSLPASDKNIFDGDQTGPAAGLIASHDNSPNATPIQEVIFPVPQLIYSKPIELTSCDRVWSFSHDFSDKTTWYGDSVRVVDETLSGDGITYNFAHSYIIDLSHGKIADEDIVIPTPSQGGSSFIPVIKVGGITKTEREFGEETGGDYEIDYATGTLTFYTQVYDTVTATYYYATNSNYYVRPSNGQKITITSVELLFTKDVCMTDALAVAVFTYNPYLGTPPQKFIYQPSYSLYKRFYDLVSWSRGSFPVIPKFGTGPRMAEDDIVQLRIDYMNPLVLRSSYGMEFRCWTTKHKEFTGSSAGFTAYGITEQE